VGQQSNVKLVFGSYEHGDFGGTVREYGARTSYHSLTATCERAFPAAIQCTPPVKDQFHPLSGREPVAADLLTCLVV
jgi:hypothetical protein